MIKDMVEGFKIVWDQELRAMFGELRFMLAGCFVMFIVVFSLITLVDAETISGLLYRERSDPGEWGG